MDSEEIASRAGKLRQIATISLPKYENPEETSEPLSVSFLQSYTDTLARFLENCAIRGTKEFWDQLPTISPLSSGDYLVMVQFGTEIESFSGTNMRNSGIVFAAPKGTSVRATAAGTIEEYGFHPQKGHFIKISHGNGVVTTYSHLDVTMGVRGMAVKKGETIGRVGESGWCVGPQLLYEIEKKASL